MSTSNSASMPKQANWNAAMRITVPAVCGAPDARPWTSRYAIRCRVGFRSYQPPQSIRSLNDEPRLLPGDLPQWRGDAACEGGIGSREGFPSAVLLSVVGYAAVRDCTGLYGEPIARGTGVVLALVSGLGGGGCREGRRNCCASVGTPALRTRESHMAGCSCLIPKASNSYAEHQADGDRSQCLPR